MSENQKVLESLHALKEALKDNNSSTYTPLLQNLDSQKCKELLVSPHSKETTSLIKDIIIYCVINKDLQSLKNFLSLGLSPLSSGEVMMIREIATFIENQPREMLPLSLYNTALQALQKEFIVGMEVKNIPTLQNILLEIQSSDVDAFFNTPYFLFNDNNKQYLSIFEKASTLHDKKISKLIEKFYVQAIPPFHDVIDSFAKPSNIDKDSYTDITYCIFVL
jgi:hypothetical protein